jgi:hypothetical protein
MRTKKIRRGRRHRRRRDEHFSASRFRLYRTYRLAELFDVHPATIWRWRQTGVLPEPAAKIGGIEAWTDAQIAPLIEQRPTEAGDVV